MVIIERQKALALVLVIGVWGLVMTAWVDAGSPVTIVATVSDGYQLVGDDGQPYEVENTDKGRKVEVVGTVVDEVDYKIFTVHAFRILEDE